MSPAYGYVKITTTPENGATILIDDNEISGKTPYTSDKLKSGKHKITVKKEMYQPKSMEFTVTDGKTTEETIVLSPNFANLTISTQPEADIYIDGSKTGNGTYKGRILAGVHTFEGKKEKHYPDKKDKETQAGEDVIINLILQPKQGNLDIVSNPIDAIVFLNGEKKGTTPLTLKKLLIGDYELKLEKQGFGTVTKTITVTESKTTDISETLPAGKEVKVTCSDVDAELYIDGKASGKFPKIITLSFGEHTLSAKKSGCTEIPKKINISNSSVTEPVEGNEIITLDAGCVISCNDSRDNKKYKTVKIGSQTWMAENLNYNASGSWCYKDETSNCNTYGRLYDWQTAKIACPSGWHLPSDAEWTQLTDNLLGESVAGGKMKEIGTSHWNSPNTGADNSSDFTAVPGGYRNDYGTFGSIGSNGNWWSSTEYDSYPAWKRSLNYVSSNFVRSYLDKSSGFSVRCVRDF